MISLYSFAKQLKAAKVPYYAYPKFEPTEIFERYNFSIISGVREINTKGSSKNTRQKEYYRIDKKTQQRIWNKLVKPTSEILPYTIAISSSVNDYLAHEVSGMLLLAILRNHRGKVRPTWSWYTPKWDPYISKGVRPDIIFIRSILPSQKRLYNIKDILDYYYNSLKIVILGGINGIDFFDNYLKTPINGAIHVEGYKGVVPKDLWVRDDSGQLLDNNEFKYPLFTVDNLGKTILQNFKTGID